MLGVDVERLASDTAVLGTAGEALRERWAQVLALRARTQGLGLSEVGGGDDPLAVMAGLPERQREAMALCYTLGLSNAEAAKVMEISVKAYESLLVRAKKDIRARLEGTET